MKHEDGKYVAHEYLEDLSENRPIDNIVGEADTKGEAMAYYYKSIGAWEKADTKGT